MRKFSYNAIVSLICCTITFSLPAISYASTASGDNLYSTEDNLDIVDNDESLSTQTALSLLGNLDEHSLLNDLSVENRLVLFDNMIEEINQIVDSDLREDYLLRLIELALTFLEDTNNIFDAIYVNQLIVQMESSAARTDFATRYNVVYKRIINDLKKNESWDGNDIVIEWIDDLQENQYSENIPNINNSYDNYMEQEGVNGNSSNNPSQGSNSTGNSNKEDLIGSIQNYKYVVEGKLCYKVTTSADGSKTKTPARYNELGFCPYKDTSEEINKEDSNGTNNSSNDNTQGNESGGYLDNPVIKTSDITLQYTLDKNIDSPYYYDTGIRVTTKGTVTYEQLKDAMYQLAIRNGGVFVNDSNKFLIVLEGKIIVIKDNKKEIKTSNIEKVFDDFIAEIRALNTRIGSICSVTDYIEIKGLDSITIKNKNFDLENKPIISNSRVLLPLQEIAELLGAKVKVNKDSSQILIQEGSTSITYTVNKETVMINDEIISLDVATKLSSSNIMYGYIQPMLTALGYDIEWNSISNELLVKSVN